MYGKPRTDGVKNAISKSRVEKFNFYSESNRGSKNPSSKLTEDKVMIIKKLIAEGSSNTEIATIFSVSRRLINGIRLGNTWAHIKI